jgi:hypothetical protein
MICDKCVHYKHVSGYNPTLCIIEHHDECAYTTQEQMSRVIEGAECKDLIYIKKELIFHSHYPVKATAVAYITHHYLHLFDEFDRVRIGFSITSHKDNFCKKTGVKIARHRARHVPTIQFQLTSFKYGTTTERIISSLVDDIFCSMSVSKKYLNNFKRMLHIQK